MNSTQKYKTTSLPTLIKRATGYFNTYIRNRDVFGKYFRCISCNKIKSLAHINAGHFYSAGQYPTVRFDERNVHAQCVQCNLHLHGNLVEYRKNLINKIGVDEFEKLEAKALQSKRGYKIDRAAIILIIEKYKLLTN